MPKERIIDILGLKNIEPEISKIIGEELYSEILEVTLNENKLTIVFDEPNKNWKKISCFVKQVSKKKYAGLDKYLWKIMWQGGSIVKVIELPEVWLIFLNKKTI